MNSTHRSPSAERNGFGYYAGWVAYTVASYLILWGIVALARLLPFPFNVIVTFSICFGLGHGFAYINLPIWYLVTIPGVFIVTSSITTTPVAYFIVALIFSFLFLAGYALGESNRQKTL